MEANWDAYVDSCIREGMLDDQESDTNFNPADEPNGLMEHVMEVGEDGSIYDALGLQPPPTTEEEWEDQQGMVVPLPDNVAQSVAQSLAEHRRRLQQQRTSLRLRDEHRRRLQQRPEDVYAPWQLAELDMQRMEMEQAGIFPRVRLSFD